VKNAYFLTFLSLSLSPSLYLSIKTHQRAAFERESRRANVKNKNKREK
jgi:hypothetical protein